MDSDAGSIVTVEGRIDPTELGVTLPHEHILIDNVENGYEPPDTAAKKEIAERPVQMEDLWWIRENPYAHRDNLRLGSVEDAVEELAQFRRAGGDAVVDVTTKDRSDPKRIRGIARETGLTIVQGTAFYTRSSHPDRIEEASVDDLTSEFVDDIQNGIGETDVRAGIIGEIGITGDEQSDGETRFIHPHEKKVLRAGARAAVQTGAPLSIHPPSERSLEYPTSRRCLEVLDVVEDEGLDPKRVIFCHRDQSKWIERDLTYQRELADRGSYVEFDLFGHADAYHPQFDDAQGSDRDRVKWTEELVADGYADRLLLSHDIYMKMFTRKYGGYGYAHILDSIVPDLKARGVSEAEIQTLLVENPRRILTFDEAA
jgi:phosphotriesterase-related protein